MVTPDGTHEVVAEDFSAAAHDVARHVRAGTPVLLDVSLVDRTTARRLLDFASGLTYGLSGSLQKVGEALFLLGSARVDPPGAATSAETPKPPTSPAPNRALTPTA